MPDTGPTLSIVVVSFSQQPTLERCLAALVLQVESARAEILVVRRPPDASPVLRQRFPDVRWIAAAQADAVPHMRSLGISSSRGAVVALLEDDCEVADGWCAALLSAHRQPWAAVGGAIEPGHYRKALDWGVYFCEYARFMQPFAGDVAALPGNNISYKRTALAKLTADIDGDSGFHEVFANATLRQSGEVLVAVPEMTVYNINSWSRNRITEVPYHHGRGYAGLRLAGRHPTVRLAFAAMALVLPAIQVGRVVGEIVGRRRLIAQLLKAFPAILLFALSWSAGEWMGCLFGPGKSLDRWR